MLHLVEVANEGGDILSLPIGPLSNGIILTGVDGLDPGKATLISSDFAQQDGSEFHTARRESRNILMGLSLDSRFGGGTIRALRQQLYNFFMPKMNITMSFHLEEGLVFKIDGVVESINSPMFSSRNGAVISIMCFNPDFYDQDLRITSGEAFIAPVEYPIDYDGTVPTGYKITLNVPSANTGFTVYHRLPSTETNVLEFRSALQAGDQVVIDTVPGQKSALILRGSDDISILSGIDPQSVWPKLAPGENHIAIVTSNSSATYNIEYYRRFGGM